uniref:EOG090X0GPG n=1 Tax=Daphnia dolichocephala TaxID=2282166 RepID=A0A4Y7M2N7_9CRUS|nr:EOG090X0GPG [Daphnia dolichocephala]
MSEAGNKRKAKDKAFYIKSAKQARKSSNELGPGQKGFLCTSNRERDSVREAYNILNEHADILYGGEGPRKDVESAEVKGEEIEDELTKEMDELKKKQAAPVSERRFQSVLTGIKGCIFIRSTVENPLEIVDAIISDIEKKKQQTTKFLLRMLPIQLTCKSIKEDILKAAETLVDKMANHKTFSLLIKIRNHNIKRDDLIVPIAEIVAKKFPEMKVDLDNPEISMVVEVLRSTCCLGVVTDYAGRAKYNLLEIAQKAK